MLVFIILIFLNSNFVNALDESSENRYINELPEKEKKELLERVARRIIQEVKSNEAIAGFESGEVPEEELKIHSEYVGKLLREERENLNKRRFENMETELLKTNNNLVESTTVANNNNDNAKTIDELEKTTEKVIDNANDENKESLVRNKDDSLDKLQEIEKVNSKVYNKEESEKSIVLENDNIANNDKRAVLDLTLRSDAIHDNVKVDEDKVLDVLVDEKQESNSGTKPSRSKRSKTVTNETNVRIDDKLNEKTIDPVSIEITFVNDQEEDSKKDKANITDEIPVKVLYDKKIQEELSVKSTLDTPKLTQNASNISAESQKPKIKKEEKTRHRKTFSDDIDEHVQEIHPTLDNQISRKKRTSKSGTDSVEIKDRSSNNSSNTTELAHNNNLEDVTEVDKGVKQTAIEINKMSELISEASIVFKNDTKLKVTTEQTLSSSTINLSPSFIANVTTPTLLREVKSFAEKVETKPDGIPENVTKNPELQHTQIDNFDVDENETTSVWIINANNTGSTTEEIVKMRTQTISGYPEDSHENSTTTIAPESKNEYSRSYPELKPKNVSTVNETIINLRTHLDLNNTSSKSVDLNIQQDPKVEKISLPDPAKEKEESVSNLNNETSATKATEQLISSTTNTLPTILKKKELYYAMELPKNDSVVAFDNQNIISAPKPIDKSKKPLRLGIAPEDDFENSNGDVLLKIKPARNAYVVYEILPGQKPFIKKESIVPAQPKSQKRTPASFPKLSLYETNKQEITNQIHTEQDSQIEQPNYAPVYNYAPEYAYYNPRNIYGPNADDENVKIIDERSNERNEEGLHKIFDYGIPKSFERQAPDDYIVTKRNKKSEQKSKLKRISEDYYFGFAGPDLNEIRHQRTGKLASRKRSKRNKRKKTKKPEWKQNLKVPPNSDEYEHPRNAMFKKRPPITHSRQVGAILANLGYFGYNHNHLYTSVSKKSPFDNSPDKSSESWVGPHKTRNETKKKKFLRSSVDSVKQQNKSTMLQKLLSVKISNNLKKTLKVRLMNKNKTFHYNNQNFAPNLDKPHHAKRTLKEKRHMFLLTGYPKSKYDERKIPMLVLTGRPKENYWDDNYNRKTKNTGNFYKNRYVLGQESSESKYKLKKKKKNVYLNDYDDSEELNGNIGRNGADEIYYQDPGDVSEVYSRENETLGTLNMDTVNYILDYTEKHANMTNIESNLIDTFKKLKLLYYPPKKPVKKEYDHILKEHDSNLVYFLRSDRDKKELEAYITVIKDMINMNKNYALENYDWLGSTVDIRSAMKKLAMVSGVINESPNRIHPKDLQLIKYVLYLYTTTKSLLQPTEENDVVFAEKVSDEYPKNKRFAYEENQSIDLPKNMRFPVENREYVPLQKSIRFSRRKSKPITKKPWLNNDGLKERLDELIWFVEEMGDLLNDLHDAIKHISYIMKYDSKTWFKNLKDLYLSKPSRKTALEVLLHLETARLIQLIEESAINGLDANYVKYSMSNPEEVKRTKEEFAFVIKLYLELKKLQ